MKRTTPQVMLAGLTCLLLVGPAAAQTVVYDNTTTYTGVDFPLGNLLLGSEVTLAGTARVVTGIDVFLRLDGDSPATFEVQITFFKNDLNVGGENRPGTLLWDSGRVPQMIDSGAPVSFHFAVPNVLVPDTFTWAIDLRNQQGNMGLLGPSEFNPPTIGQARPGFWEPVGGPQEWDLFHFDEAPFGARVMADPACPGLDDCFLPAEAGPCEGICPRFYYNALTGQCEEFVWGCCQGNANNFETKKACEDSCVTTGSHCLAPPGPSPCDAIEPRYYYNSENGQCEFFEWGGCCADYNLFLTPEVCEQACGGLAQIAIPTTSQWGIVASALLILIIGTIAASPPAVGIQNSVQAKD